MMTEAEYAKELADKLRSGDLWLSGPEPVEPAAAAMIAMALSAVAKDLDGRDFYELCQQYRHERHDPQVSIAFERLKDYIKTGRLPWPSYDLSSAAPHEGEKK
jgi:ABC-type phosphate transport system auxiliary subunit